MKTIYNRLFIWLLVLTTALTTACTGEATDNEEPLPEGMGRIRVTICSPEKAPGQTRAVNAEPWEVPDHEWERLQTFRILICDADNKVVQIIEGDKDDMGETNTATSTGNHKYQSATVTSDPLSAGSYKIYATANYADGYSIGDPVAPNATVKFANGYSEDNIPMTGRLADPVTVNIGEETNAGTIMLWRVLGKLQFYFTNEATEEIKVYGIEVEPINQASVSGPGIYLFSKDDLTSEANLAAGTGITLPPAPSGEGKKSAREDIGPVRYEPETALTLAAYSGSGDKPTGTLFFYVNETDATFTTTQNQLSLRFKIKRGNGAEEELRYGMTTNYGNGSEGQNGFNVIRRNDWIHIPIILTDWQFRIEPIAFVPIAGYPAKTLSSDGLTATFSTGGMIALQPFVKKKGDPTWRDFSNPEITNVSISCKSQTGSESMIATNFVFDDATKYIIGELNNSLSPGTYMTTVTVNAQLGSYPYSFTFNIKLQK